MNQQADYSAWTAEHAVNPAVPAEHLAQLAAGRPDLWSAILQNPNCYPELRTWITSQMPAAPAAPQPGAPAPLSQTAAYPQGFAQPAPNATGQYGFQAPVAAAANPHGFSAMLKTLTDTNVPVQQKLAGAAPIVIAVLALVTFVTMFFSVAGFSGLFFGWGDAATLGVATGFSSVLIWLLLAAAIIALAAPLVGIRVVNVGACLLVGAVCALAIIFSVIAVLSILGAGYTIGLGLIIQLIMLALVLAAVAFTALPALRKKA